MLQTAAGNAPATNTGDILGGLNFLLILLTLTVSYLAYRTQHVSTRIIDASTNKRSTTFLIKNMSHTSHVVLRVKMRFWHSGDDEPRDMAEACLDPEATDVHYLYPDRPGTSKIPELAYRIELGPLDFSRFRTIPPNMVFLRTSTPGIHQSGGTVQFHYAGVESFENLRESYQAHVEQNLANGRLDERPLPPYVLPDDVERIKLEVHQTGETYILRKEDDGWEVTSKRKRVVEMEENEYRMGPLAKTPANIYYLLRYDLLS